MNPRALRAALRVDSPGDLRLAQALDQGAMISRVSRMDAAAAAGTLEHVLHSMAARGQLLDDLQLVLADVARLSEQRVCTYVSVMTSESAGEPVHVALLVDEPPRVCVCYGYERGLPESEPVYPGNLLQVRRILDDFIGQPQHDPEDISSMTGHALDCVMSTPEQFRSAQELLALLRSADVAMSEWDWSSDPPPPQLAFDDSWWAHEAWSPIKRAFAAARALLPPIGPAEAAELERQGAWL